MAIDDDDSFDSDYLRDEATRDGWAPTGEECDDFLEDDLIDYDFSCPGYYNEAGDKKDIDWSTASGVDFDWNDVRIDWTDIRNEIAYDAWLYKDPDDINNTDDDDENDDDDHSSNDDNDDIDHSSDENESDENETDDYYNNDDTNNNDDKDDEDNFINDTFYYTSNDEADDTDDIDWSTANDVDFDWNDVRIDWTDDRTQHAYDAWLYKDDPLPDDNNNTDDDDDYDDYDDWENQKDTAQTATPTTLEAAKSAAKQRALELRQLGAVVFSGYFQCLHCGEYGTTSFPHNWKPCAACKPCKNCGGIHAGRSTSDCPSPDPNIYDGNTPVAAWGMQF
jgi:hypothetical protein